MKESKQKKNRRCRRCPNVIYGDAKRMQEHEAEHRIVARALAAGLVIPKSTQVRGGTLV